jgi:hypothetical protein
MRLSQTCRSSESARGREKGGRTKGTAYGDTLVLATAVYVVVAGGDTKY